MSTELTTEFTHFNPVIRLSKVQQLALLFCAFDDVLRLLWSQGFLATMPVCQLEAVQKPPETSFFLQLSQRQTK